MEKTRPLKTYLAIATLTETYTTYLKARNETEAYEICMNMPLAELRLSDTVGEWEFELVEEPAISKEEA